MKSYESIRVQQRRPRRRSSQLHRPERINALGKSMLLEIHDAWTRSRPTPRCA